MINRLLLSTSTTYKKGFYEINLQLREEFEAACRKLFSLAARRNQIVKEGLGNKPRERDELVMFGDVKISLVV